jgi:hypothetical protein
MVGMASAWRRHGAAMIGWQFKAESPEIFQAVLFKLFT